MINKDNNAVLSLKNDYCFKAVYGSDDEDSKRILMSLLNKILDRQEDPIVHLEYKNPFQAKVCIDDKETILDIKAVANSNEIIDIEMQIIWDRDMPERLMFYAGGMIREALKEGQSYDMMMPSIVICITNSIIDPKTEQFVNNYYFMEEKTNEKLSDKCRICCIELPKVNADGKTAAELNSLEICLEYLKYADETSSEYIADLIRAGGEELQMAQEKFVRVTQDEILREQALAREIFQRDKLTMQHRAKEIEEKEIMIEEKEVMIEEKEVMLEEKEAMLEQMKKQAEEAQKQAEEAQKQAEEAQKQAEENQRQAEETQRQAEENQRQAEETQRQAEDIIKSNAIKMKADGMPVEKIMKYTNLSREVIDTL